MIDSHDENGKRKPRRQRKAPETMPLFDHVETPKQTKKKAFIASRKTLPKNSEIVLAFIRKQGDYGAMMYEASVGTSVLYQSMSSVYANLKEKGLIRHNGVERPTPSGIMAAVAVAVEVSA
ncbi:hypothetical protein Q31b_19700 [Novipirellula aureliae]|uniref:Uncharacterized protein n=1 Tax=Novipirellula aureliae TaxID=2527966 RepID=A0A5C6E4L6_9BACT|nr:hypothetical protein [Novipirellula aureliae]TWU42937.1 hypothetical protein Q31b_19700 [Novipirellula aureliae]